MFLSAFVKKKIILEKLIYLIFRKALIFQHYMIYNNF